MFKVVVLVACISAVFAYPTGYGGANPEGNAQIKRLESELNHDGSYQYVYETTNGITAQEHGVGGHQAVGGFSYISPEGIPISLSYTADEHGFRAQGDHLPVQPQIPEEILKSLQWNAAHPEEDDPNYEKASRHY